MEGRRVGALCMCVCVCVCVCVTLTPTQIKMTSPVCFLRITHRPTRLCSHFCTQSTHAHYANSSSDNRISIKHQLLSVHQRNPQYPPQQPTPMFPLPYVCLAQLSARPLLSPPQRWPAHSPLCMPRVRMHLLLLPLQISHVLRRWTAGNRPRSRYPHTHPKHDNDY